MANKSKKQEDNQQSVAPLPFHQRFNIEIDLEEGQRRFMNRVNNLAPDCFNRATTNDHQLPWKLATILGMEYRGENKLEHFLTNDFYSCLRTLEVAYSVISSSSSSYYLQDFTERIETILSLSEIDLGIRWKDGVFWKSGAKLLDEALVNEPLQWLSNQKYHNVLAPFEKGLRLFLEATKYPERLADTVTDMYEALEAMAKVATSRPNKDLSGNRELFVKKLGLTDYYNRMLKDYISYANEFRHAVEEGEERKPPLAQEVEAFIYTTGLFIRLAIERLNIQKSVSP